MPRSSKQLPEGSFYRDLGSNLRAARIAAGKSQTEAAEHLDVAFQQVQKYENGTDRITVHRLICLAAFLEVPIQQFIAPSKSDFEFQRRMAKFSGKEFHTLMEAWGEIAAPLRALLLNLIKYMAKAKA